jgi:hypothetical protein
MPKRLTPKFLVKKGSSSTGSPRATCASLGSEPERLSDDPLEAPPEGYRTRQLLLARRIVARMPSGRTGLKARLRREVASSDLPPLLHRTAGWVSAGSRGVDT